MRRLAWLATIAILSVSGAQAEPTLVFSQKSGPWDVAGFINAAPLEIACGMHTQSRHGEPFTYMMKLAKFADGKTIKGFFVIPAPFPVDEADRIYIRFDNGGLFGVTGTTSDDRTYVAIPPVDGDLAGIIRNFRNERAMQIEVRSGSKFQVVNIDLRGTDTAVTATARCLEQTTGMALRLMGTK